MSVRVARLALVVLDRRARAPQPRDGAALGRRACATPRSTSWRPGRTSLLLVALAAALVAARRAAHAPLGRPARARVRRDRRRLLAVCRSRGSTARRRRAGSCTRSAITCSRSAPTSSDGSSRSTAPGGGGSARRSSASRAASRSGGSSTCTSCRSRRGATRACRAGSRSSSGLAYRVPLGPAGELDPQHRRGEPGPPARLDVPEPARDRLRARRRPAPARRRAPAALDDRGRRRRLRRASLDAHARGVPRARRRAPRARGSCAARGRTRGSPAGSIVVSLGVRRRVPDDRAADDLHGDRARMPARERRGGGGSGSGALDPGESSTASHFRALRDGIRTVAEHPWGFGLGNAGVSASRTAPTSRRASRRTPSSASTRACSGSPRSSAGSSRSPSRSVAGRRG